MIHVCCRKDCQCQQTEESCIVHVLPVQVLLKLMGKQYRQIFSMPNKTKSYHSWDWILEALLQLSATTGLLQGCWHLAFKTRAPITTPEEGQRWPKAWEELPISSFSHGKTSCYLTWLWPKTTSMHVFSMQFVFMYRILLQNFGTKYTY